MIIVLIGAVTGVMHAIRGGQYNRHTGVEEVVAAAVSIVGTAIRMVVDTIGWTIVGAAAVIVLVTEDIVNGWAIVVAIAVISVIVIVVTVDDGTVDTAMSGIFGMATATTVETINGVTVAGCQKEKRMNMNRNH